MYIFIIYICHQRKIQLSSYKILILASFPCDSSLFLKKLWVTIFQDERLTTDWQLTLHKFSHLLTKSITDVQR